MNHLYRKFFKNMLVFAIVISSVFTAPYSCLAEETAPSNSSESANNETSPNTGDNNSQNNNTAQNNKESKKTQNKNSQNENNQSAPENTANSEQTIQNENPSVKSKKVPIKKSIPETQKSDAEKTKNEAAKSTAEETKISLPDVLPEDISPLNSVSPTYQDESENNIIKSIVSWILIAIGVIIILFVIISNKKMPADSSNLFQGRHDLKTNLKNSINYDKNIRRK